MIEIYVGLGVIATFCSVVILVSYRLWCKVKPYLEYIYTDDLRLYVNNFAHGRTDKDHFRWSSQLNLLGGFPFRWLVDVRKQMKKIHGRLEENVGHEVVIKIDWKANPPRLELSYHPWEVVLRDSSGREIDRDRVPSKFDLNQNLAEALNKHKGIVEIANVLLVHPEGRIVAEFTREQIFQPEHLTVV